MSWPPHWLHQLGNSADAGNSNDSGLLFRYAAPNWVYNLNTKSLAAGTYTITLQMPDGLNYTAAFVLK